MAEVMTKNKTKRREVLTQEEINQLLTAINGGPGTFNNLEEFTAYLTERRQKEELYGFSQSLIMCRFFETTNNENILADIEKKNKEQNMGNINIPNTNIKLINFSICPKCGRTFSFKELIDYYANPNSDSAFKSRKRQYREDTRAFCHE